MAKQKTIAIALRLDEPYPHHQQVFEGVRRYAKEHADWKCLIDEYPGYRLDQRGPNYPTYDGVIARADEVMQDRLKQMGIPLVNTHYQYMRAGAPGVYADPAGIGQLAARHLLDRGFRQLCILVDSTHRFWAATSSAFKQCAEEEEAQSCTHVEMGIEAYTTAEDWMDFEQLISELLERLEPPVGVFIEDAANARVLIQQSIAHGWRVPQDIAVICQHNLRAVVDVSPQISRVDVNYDVFGYKAAEMLDQLMAGHEPPKEHLFVSPIGIIGRESTDYFAITDKVVSEALQLIANRLDQKLRIDDIAYELAVSSSQLKKRFVDTLGRNVGEEIRRLRIEVAKRMLADRDQQVTQVAKASGFNTPDVMNQVFRRELGMTPTDYRKNVLGWS